jgi:hypothetical protein
MSSAISLFFPDNGQGRYHLPNQGNFKRDLNEQSPPSPLIKMAEGRLGVESGAMIHQFIGVGLQVSPRRRFNMSGSVGWYNAVTKKWEDGSDYEEAMKLLKIRIEEYDHEQREQVRNNPPEPPQIYCKNKQPERIPVTGCRGMIGGNCA